MIEIKNMALEHIAQVAELERQCFSDPWSAEAFQSELTNPLSLWLVACEDDGRVSGYIGSQQVLDAADVMNIAVCVDKRHSGIATQLIQTLCLRLTQRDACFLTLEVRQSNQPAISLYQKLGFVQVGYRKGYYRKPKEDALILQRRLCHADYGC